MRSTPQWSAYPPLTALTDLFSLQLGRLRNAVGRYKHRINPVGK
jgi:hypothetical protein